MYVKFLHRKFIVLLLSASFLTLTSGCMSSRTQSPTYGTSYDPYKAESIEEIQYRSAYKYDNTGKKYIKHYRQKKKKEN